MQITEQRYGLSLSLSLVILKNANGCEMKTIIAALLVPKSRV